MDIGIEISTEDLKIKNEANFRGKESMKEKGNIIHRLIENLR